MCDSVFALVFVQNMRTLDIPNIVISIPKWAGSTETDALKNLKPYRLYWLERYAFGRLQ